MSANGQSERGVIRSCCISLDEIKKIVRVKGETVCPKNLTQWACLGLRRNFRTEQHAGKSIFHEIRVDPSDFWAEVKVCVKKHKSKETP